MSWILGIRAVAEPGLGGTHDRGAETATLRVLADGDVVDPAAMTVVADHRGGDEHTVRLADEDRR